jgi:beta-lactamase superfamily II metal-dependent hydrolase
VLIAGIVTFALAGSAQLPKGGLQAKDIQAGNQARAAVSVLSIGPGQCVVVSCPNGATIVNDCGSMSGTESKVLIDAARDFFNQVLPPNGPLYVVVSHADVDHYNLIPRFIDTQRHVDGIVLGGARADYGNGPFADWLNANEGRRTPIMDGIVPAFFSPPGVPDSDLPCGTSAADGIYMLSANAGRTTNDKSLMLKLAHGTVSATIMGDAQAQTANAALAHYQATPLFLQTTLLVAAHHGSDSGSSNSPAWATATVPNAVTYSTGGGLSRVYGHPRCTTASVYQTSSGSRVASAAAHSFTCYDAKEKPNATTQTVAQWNTVDQGAVVLLSEQNDWGVWTCPSNAITACSKSAAR